jgi:formate hydrogenlyase subunit 3/multisubunit Na+/H+ antiporter MnhD subunit
MLVGAVLVRVARSRVQLISGLALGLGTVVLTVGGAAALGLGVVVLADVWPSQLHHWLNVDHGGGVVAVVAGSAGIAAAITAPLTLRRTAASTLAPEAEHESPAPDPDEPEEALDPTLSGDEQAS